MCPQEAKAAQVCLTGVDHLRRWPPRLLPVRSNAFWSADFLESAFLPILEWECFLISDFLELPSIPRDSSYCRMLSMLPPQPLCWGVTGKS